MVAVVVVAFAPAVGNEFVAWDDDKNFLENPHYRGLGPDQLRWMWTTFHLGAWIPLSWMTLGLDYLLWGMNPIGYHITNNALHAGTALLVYRLSRHLLPAWSPPAASVFAALFFAVHPLRVESVAWITERRDVLSGLFYVATVTAYVRATREARPASYGIPVGTFVLALLAKGTAVTLPVVLALLNVYPLRRLGGTKGWWNAGARLVYAELLPFVALAAVFTAIVFTALQPVPQLSLPGKIAVSAYSLWFYVSRTIVPVGLSPLYAMPGHVDPLAAEYLAAGMGAVAAAVWLWMARRRHPGVVTCLVAFVAILFPLLGVHQGGPQIAADRITYNASLALAMLAGGAVTAAWRRAPRLAVAGAVVVITTLLGLTWRQIRVWRDSATLWTRVVEVEPASPYGHNNLGNVYARQGRLAEASAHYRAAIDFKPDYAEAYSNLGVVLAATGALDEAIAAHRHALAIRPDDDEARNNLGIALVRSGDLPGGIAQFAEAVRINPANAAAYVNWGNALQRVGRVAESVARYQAALSVNSAFADAHHNWGVALARMGRFTDAETQFVAALAAHPAHAEAADYLARVRAILRDSVARPSVRPP